MVKAALTRGRSGRRTKRLIRVTPAGLWDALLLWPPVLDSEEPLVPPLEAVHDPER
jgi:hypothetical protein